ncbi:hypothetical protein T484DRAFT_1750114 [Baffinella frigidus]|nr:hypothetical protein T484DRAFT_1750114 [Cryptophyta sp. CCMP2293]
MLDATAAQGVGGIRKYQNYSNTRSATFDSFDSLNVLTQLASRVSATLRIIRPTTRTYLSVRTEPYQQLCESSDPLHARISHREPNMRTYSALALCRLTTAHASGPRGQSRAEASTSCSTRTPSAPPKSFAVGERCIWIQMHSTNRKNRGSRRRMSSRDLACRPRCSTSNCAPLMRCMNRVKTMEWPQRKASASACSASDTTPLSSDVPQ